MAKTATKSRVSDEDRPETATDWLSEVDQALKREKSWRDRAKKVVRRYRDERSTSSTTSRVNILWSNTEVLKGALNPRTPKPDVRRRFPDTEANTQISRAAAEVVERALFFVNDATEVDDPIASAIEDLLLPGRGTCWVSYEPEIEGDEGYGVEGNAGNSGDDIRRGGQAASAYPAGDASGGSLGSVLGEGSPAPRITDQKLTPEYVYWEDFCHGKARKWCDVPWVARRHVLRKDQFKSKFPNAREGARAAYKLEDATDMGDDGSPEFVEVWEIWDKPSYRRLYVGRGYADVLQSDDDPYGLTGLFPCPRPLFSVTTTDKLIPSPEFLQYQDQANELDTLATRVGRLLEQLQFKGGYDATMGGDQGPLKDISKAGDGEFIPVANWSMLKEKGGIEGVYGFWPIERIAPIIAELTDRAQRLTQQIYEVTGISDIIRGSTDPNETKGAQQLKAQFGSMRMQARQKEVHRFIRDLYRMMAEIIAEHFTEDTLKDITGLEFDDAQPTPMMGHNGPPAGPLPMQPQQPPMGLPPAMAAQGGPAPQPGTPPPVAQGGQATMPGEMPDPGANKPSWDAVMQILRSDRMRSYRIDVETDATVLEDAEAEKASRIEFMGAVNDMLEKAYLAATQAPMMLPIIRETFLFGIRTFKVGRTLEQAAEDAFDELMKNPPAPPQPEQPPPTGPDPAIEQGKLQIEGKKVEQDGQYKAAQIGLEREKLTFEQQRALVEQQAAAQAAMTPAAPVGPTPADMQKAQSEEQRMAFEREKFAHEKQMAERDFALRSAAQNKQIYDEASEAMQGEGGTAPEGQSTPTAASPIELMLGAIQQLASAIAQGQAAETANIASLTQALTAPKQIVRGADGRAVSVQTVLQ